MNMSLNFIAISCVLIGFSSPQESQEPTTAAGATTTSAFTTEHLEQMAAPIALYPDALVAQILMASTYPIEVVEASRWIEQIPNLRGEALEEALKGKEWDPSVKALCGFPTVLKLMNDNLSWTRDLGDAFLAQQPELMDTIQFMRLRALEAGNLETTEEQQVIREERTIIIQAANPEVIYVPYYEPVYVYGPYWHYPHWYYPGCYIAPRWGHSHHSHFSFSIGFHWGGGLWGGFNWRDRDCHVDPHRFNHFNSRTNHHAAHTNFARTARHPERWQHNPRHRGGVDYKSPQVAQKFGSEPRLGRLPRALQEPAQSTSSHEGVRGGDTGTEKRAVTQPSDSASRSSAPRAERDRSGTFQRKQDAGPVATRKPRDQAISPSSPIRRSDSVGAGRKDGGVRENERPGSSDVRAPKARARNGESSSGSKSGAGISSGRSSKSSGGGATATAPGSGESRGGARGGSASSGARTGKSSGGAVNSGVRSGGSGGGRGGAVSGNGRSGKFSG